MNLKKVILAKILDLSFQNKPEKTRFLFRKYYFESSIFELVGMI